MEINQPLDRQKNSPPPGESRFGLAAPEILLPGPGTDLTKWAVIACDQYSSEPAYWEGIRKAVGDSPSALHLIYPECYLEEENPQERIAAIGKTMESYLKDRRLLSQGPGFILVRRDFSRPGPPRWGLLAALDLEDYDYRPGAESLIRPTEKTILSRIPPRRRIREQAPLELPHILILLNDPRQSLIEPLRDLALAGRLKVLYDFDLSPGSGHLRGYQVKDSPLVEGVFAALEELNRGPGPLYAVGDGNHSLAAAKAVWEAQREDPPQGGNPARFALAELVNLFDPGIVFHPIHRVLFQLESPEAALKDLLKTTGLQARELGGRKELVSYLTGGEGGGAAGVCYTGETGERAWGLPLGKEVFAVPLFQDWLDDYLSRQPGRLDFIHGLDSALDLASLPGSFGLLLPSLGKENFFTLIRSGVLPRKTFSLGLAEDKRFYLEARRI
ncbi:MAG: DUF1015 domain-containing protein [Spirochaetales bacterium]|jgi:hypothetical protein|nr:DUF1015 domain-containing protein [Spirochaetales bacterium]